MRHTINLEVFSSEAMHIFEWDNIKSPILLVILAATQVITLGGKAMIITYVAKFAPAKRPINTLIMIDQASRILCVIPA